MSALRAWVDTPEGRAIVAEIIAEQPTYSFRSGRLPALYGGYPTAPERRYEGKAAGKLRRLWNATADKVFAEADAAFARGVPWEEAGAAQIAMLASQPDTLIAQLLEPEPDFDDGPTECADCGEQLVNGKCEVGCEPKRLTAIEPARHVLTDRVVKSRKAA